MDINNYNEEFTRYDDVVSENEEEVLPYVNKARTDQAFAEYAVPVYLRQISESLAILCEYARRAIEIIDPTPTES